MHSETCIGMTGGFTQSSYHSLSLQRQQNLIKTKTIDMEKHEIWFKRWFNPLLRKLFKLEICSLLYEEKVVGYGIRKKL